MEQFCHLLPNEFDHCALQISWREIPRPQHQLQLSNYMTRNKQQQQEWLASFFDVLLSFTHHQVVKESGNFKAHESSVGRCLGIEPARTATPVNDNHVNVVIQKEQIGHFLQEKAKKWEFCRQDGNLGIEWAVVLL